MKPFDKNEHSFFIFILAFFFLVSAGLLAPYELLQFVITRDVEDFKNKMNIHSYFW